MINLDHIIKQIRPLDETYIVYIPKTIQRDGAGKCRRWQ
jgi:hypothetical protein